MNEKVSIISIYYNREHAIRESLESVIAQSNDFYEFIVIDDGSTDKTLEILNEYKSEKVKVLTKKNSGFTASIKYAISIASGEFVAIHGSGDLSLPSRFIKQKEFLSHNKDYGLCSCITKSLYSDGTGRTELVSKPFEGKATGDLENKNFIVHGSVMFRKDIYDLAGGYRAEFKYAQDRDLWLRMSRISKFKVLNEVLYSKYKMIKGSVSGNTTQIFQQRLYSDYALKLHYYYVSHGTDLYDEYGLISSSLLRATLKNDFENMKVYLSVSKQFGKHKSKIFLPLIQRKILRWIAILIRIFLIKLRF